MQITRRGFLKAVSGLIASAAIPVSASQVLVDPVSSVGLNITKRYVPKYDAFVYEFRSQQGEHLYSYSELSSNEFTVEQFSAFKKTALQQVEKMKCKK